MIPTDDPASIFEGGKLKPGIYKIQSVGAETYVDVHLNTRQLCGRPAQNLGEGMGLVRLYPPFGIRAPDA